jgi:alpha-beta hydrolase superfamily lysophospholipase
MSTLLLVHGAWHGAWCWDQFAARLAAAGHDVRAVALRDHPPASRARLKHRIRDYVEDLAAAVPSGAPVVLIGHSMGSLVVQKYLERHDALGAALLAPVPPAGAWGATLRFGARHPLVLTKVNLIRRLGPVVGTPALAREMLFTPETPQSIVDVTVARLQEESYRAYLDMVVFDRPRPARINVPVLVLAAERDRVFTVREAHATARAYRTKAEVFAGMGHDLLLDTGWEAVADRVESWVRTLSPRETQPAA